MMMKYDCVKMIILILFSECPCPLSLPDPSHPFSHNVIKSPHLNIHVYKGRWQGKGKGEGGGGIGMERRDIKKES